MRDLHREQLGHPANVTAFALRVNRRNDYFVQVTVQILGVSKRHFVGGWVLPAPGGTGTRSEGPVAERVETHVGHRWSGPDTRKGTCIRNGARTRIRTRDQLIKSQLLYQLSYAGAAVIVFAESSSVCRRGHGRPPALLSKLLSNPKTVVKPQGVERDKLLVFPDLVSDARNLR